MFSNLQPAVVDRAWVDSKSNLTACVEFLSGLSEAMRRQVTDIQVCLHRILGVITLSFPPWFDCLCACTWQRQELIRFFGNRCLAIGKRIASGKVKERDLLSNSGKVAVHIFCTGCPNQKKYAPGTLWLRRGIRWNGNSYKGPAGIDFRTRDSSVQGIHRIWWE